MGRTLLSVALSFLGASASEAATEFTVQPLAVGAGISAIGVADINRDRIPDLLLLSERGVQPWLGDGRGGFRPGAWIAAGPEPNDLQMADLDGDESIDVVIANHDTDQVTVLLGDGTGGFSAAPGSPLHFGAQPHVHTVRLVDFDRDGRLDLLVDDRQGEAVRIRRGRGDGSFAEPALSVDVGGDPYLGVAIGDLDVDGWPDVVTPNPRHLGVVINAGRETLAFKPVRQLAAQQPFAVAIADIDGDGHPDLLAAADAVAATLQVFAGDGHGEFSAAKGDAEPLPRGAKLIAVGDFNADGIDDAVISGYFGDELVVVFGGRHGRESLRLPVPGNPWGLAVADLDQDGDDDVVVVNDAGSNLTLYYSNALDKPPVPGSNEN